MAGLLFSPSATDQRWEVWDRFLETRPDAGFRQSSWWAAAGAIDCTPAFAAMIRRGGIVLGGAVVLLRKWDDHHAAYLIPDGPVLPARAPAGALALSALVQAVRAHRRNEIVTVTHLRIAPRWREAPEHLRALSPQVALDDPAFGPREVVMLDLRSSETGLLARMSPAARGDVAMGRRFGLEVVEDRTTEGVDEFLEMAGAVGDRAVAPLVQRLQSGGHGGLLFVEDDGVRLAGALWARHGLRATTLRSAQWHGDRQRIAPTLLQFEIMRRAKAAGAAWYELAHSPFAERLGGDLVQFAPALDIVLDPGGYELYRALGHP